MGGAVEHLIVDGGSQDGSRELVLSHQSACLIDAPGSTLYQAINIGLDHAHGAWIALLNSDDVFEPGAIASMLAVLRQSQADAVRGRVGYRYSNGMQYPRQPPSTMSELTLETVLFGGPAINAMVFRRTTMERLGPFDEALTIAADRELLLRALYQGWHVEYVNLPFYRYTLHPGSLTLNQRPGSAARWTGEHVAIARRYLRKWQRFSYRGRQIHRWHAQETSRLALQKGREGRLEAATVELWNGLGQDLLLPLSIVDALVAAAIRRLRTH